MITVYCKIGNFRENIIFPNSVKRNICVVKQMRFGHDLLISVNNRVISPFCEDMRSFAKIKSSRKFPNLQYNHGACQNDAGRIVYPFLTLKVDFISLFLVNTSIIIQVTFLRYKSYIFKETRSVTMNIFRKKNLFKVMFCTINMCSTSKSCMER